MQLQITKGDGLRLELLVFDSQNMISDAWIFPLLDIGYNSDVAFNQS